jgi:putative FmdB family regulatory protein
MPIYEFYCPDCHTVFSFFTPTFSAAVHPDCPRCHRPKLDRRPSAFAALRGGRKGSDQPDEEASVIPGLEDERLEGAMDALAGEMGGLSESDVEDPKQIARFFRRFSDVSGLEPGPKLVEMLQKLESGADPDSLEEEFGGAEGDGGDSEDLSEFFQLKKRMQSARGRKPLVDETLYFL